MDLAALMDEAGAEVHLLARNDAIVFHPPPVEHRSMLQCVLQPRSRLGLGWRSKFCADVPLLFHAMPLRLRLRAVRRHLGPAAGWFIKDRVVSRVPMVTSAKLKRAVLSRDRVNLTYTRDGKGDFTLAVDHVISGTGYRVSLRKLRFLDSDMLQHVESVGDTPVLRRNFESSIPGLFMVGLASANSFGPLARFACGADFTARQLSRALV